MQSSSPVVIVGAGMSGLLAALFLKKTRPSTEIILLEHSAQAGGHYRGLDLDGFGHCDHAMRILYETGIPEMDALIRGILPGEEWIELADNEKDIAGIYWQGALQERSPYIDLRRLPEPLWRRCEIEILERARLETTSAGNAHRELLQRFGPTAAACLDGVLEKLYGVPTRQLAAYATRQPAMDRVILYGEDRMPPVLDDEKLRRVIAWPDQLTLPVKRHPPQSGLYPRRFGMRHVIDALRCQLEALGVAFRFNCKLSSLTMTGNSINAVVLQRGIAIERPSMVISGGGLHSAMALLDPRTARRSLPSCWLVYLRVTDAPAMGRLYHCYCFDRPYRSFRVTHYANYCPDARTKQGYPLCVELWSNDDGAPAAMARAESELRQMGIIAPDAPITGRAAVQSTNLHALCTLQEAQGMRAMREELKRRLPDNMIATGPFIEDGVMLLYEVWRSMYKQLSDAL